MVELKSNFECEDTYVELNHLIKDILDTRQDDGNFHSKRSFQFDEFENMLFNHLFEKTYIKKELNQLKISSDSIPYLQIIKKIDYENDNYFKKFIELLNEELNSFKDSDLKKYTFLFVTNIKELKCQELNCLTGQKLKYIEKNCEILSIFKKILNLFDIQIFEKQNYNHKTSDYNDFSHYEKIHDIIGCYRGQVLRIDINARDPFYAFDEANSKFESFLGFLSFICNRFVLSHRSRENINFRLFNIKTKKVFGLSEEDIIDIYFYLLEKDETDEIKKELRKLELIDLNSDLEIMNYSKLCNHLYELITQIDNNGLLNVLYHVFSLYHTATSEKRLEYCFFKFWIISEYLIKSSNKRKDDQMLSLIKRIVKLHNKDLFLSRRIDFLYKKRNKLVHEGKTDNINQDDRNLSKLIVDYLLSFYLYSIQHFKLKNLNDFNFLITNIGKEEITLDNHLKILNLIQDWKNPEPHI